MRRLWFLLRRRHKTSQYCWCRPKWEPQICDGRWVGNLFIHNDGKEVQ